MLKATKSFRFIVIGLFAVISALSSLPFGANAQRIEANPDANKVMTIDRSEIEKQEIEQKAARIAQFGPFKDEGNAGYGAKLGDIPARQVFEGVLAAGTCNDVLPALSNIEVEATNSSNNAGYATLQLAFAAINAGTHTGTITIDVCGNTTETASAVLNAGDVGPASWTSMVISPAGGAARTISGAIAAGSPLIDLNGADNVTINGLNTGSNSLTLSNTTIGTTAGSSTIRFQADASTNTVTNCTISGSSASTLATVAGTIVFGTGTTTGNDNNIISNNQIGPAGTNLPSKAIMASGTSSAIENDNTQITSNNIFDYFLATGAHSAINILTGNEAWTVSTNRFYQTGARVVTTASSRHSAITLNNSTGGFTVSGNTIGFAAANGTGTYTISGTSNEFRGIDSSSVRTTAPATEISNNTITAINQTSSRASTTTASSAFIAVAMGTTDGLINATGNTIGSLDGSTTIVINETSTTASTAPVIGFYNFSFFSTNISNNNVGSITIANGGAGTTVGFRGILVNTTTGVTATINNNTIAGITDSIVGSYAIYGIQSSLPNLTATGNTVRNMTGSSTGASLIISGGILASGATGANTISQNTIHSLSNASGAAANSIYGMSLTMPTAANVVERNFIHSNSLTSTVTGTQIWGIAGGAAGTTTYRNNMIRLGLDAAGASVTLPTSIIGFRDGAGATNQFFHNSVYVGGSGVLATPTASNSYCFFSDVVTVTRAHRNNIFWNARGNAVGGGVAHLATREGGTAANPAGLTSNNNVLFFSGTDGATGVFNSVVVPNLVTWRTNTGQDVNSFDLDPKYLAATGTAATVNLHIDPSVTTVIEGNGFDVGVTDDFDGQTRSGLTPTDIGADAGNFMGVDLTPPAITYTAFGNTTSTSNRVLSITATDVTGVDQTASNLPRVYFKKTTDAGYVSTACTSTGGTAQNGTYDCTIDYTLVGGGSVTGGITIQYFVVAQDTATTPNVGSNPAGVVATNVNTITTPPAPNTYNISVAVTGNFNVGAGQTYTSLTNVGGIFEFINNNVVTGPVTITLTSDLAAGSGSLVAESGTVALNQFAAPHTVTIQGEFLIEGPAAGGLIRLNGADNVTFNSAGAMRIRNTSSAPAITFINDATSNLVSGVNVESANTSTTSGTILFSTSTGTLGNSGNTISGSNIRDLSVGTGVPANGIYSSGSAGAPNASNTISSCNVFNYTSAGVLVSATGAGNTWTVGPNGFYQTASRTTDITGISILGGNGHSLTNNSFGGSDPTRGGTALTTSGGVFGITLSVGTTTATSVQNNLFGNIISTNTSVNSSIINITGGNVNVGTVNGNTIGDAAVDSITAANTLVGITNSGSGVVDIRNNTIRNLKYDNADFERLAGIYVTAGTATIRGNIIRDLVHNGNTTSTVNTTFAPFGIRLNTTTAGNVVEGNQVFNITLGFNGANSTTVYPMYGIEVETVSSTGTPTVIARNTVSGLTTTRVGTGTSAPIIAGIYAPSGAATYMNNMVNIGQSVGQPLHRGILVESTGNNNFYNNSVNVFGADAGTNNTFAFFRNTTTTGTLDIRNNIFVNGRTGTGAHFAIGTSSTTGWLAAFSNFNDLFTSVAANTGNWGGTALTFAGWQAAQAGGSGGDANSLNADPVFVSASDLHLQVNSPAINTGTTIAAVTNDFDAQTRPIAGAYDIGADEVELYTVGGMVTGLTGTGLVLQNNGGNDLAISANGAFTFTGALAPGAAYAVTVLTNPAGPTQTCTVTNGSGTIAAANVTNVAVNCVTNTYTVGGTITGLTGTGFTLRNNGGDDLVVPANATSFTFATPVASGGAYLATEFAQPTNPSQTCSITSGGSGTVTNANVTSIVVNCVTNTYTVGGMVSGLSGSGLVLRNNGGDDLPVAANGSFTFPTSVASGNPYAVTVFAQPTSPSQTCTVTNGSGTVTSANITNVSVTCTTNTYTVGGNISGLGGGTVVLQNNGGNNLAVAANGAFTFSTPIASGATYAVTVLTQPSGPTQTCTVTNGSGTVGAANVTNVSIACTTNTYTVGGMISGLNGTGLVLRNNGGDDLPVAANGSFTFTTPVASGASYNVTVFTQPSLTSPEASQNCTVTNGTGTVGGGNVTNVSIACTTINYTVGGTVSGLTGSGLVLQNNGGDNLPIGANGAFTFPTPIASGATYAVTVLTQPSSPTQTCSISNGSGTVGGANVTNVTVTCSTTTYTVGGTVSGLTGTGLVIQNNGGNNTPIAADGPFTFSTPVASGATYAVTVLTQPTGPIQSCAVTNGSGTIGNANVTNVSITCTTPAFVEFASAMYREDESQTAQIRLVRTGNTSIVSTVNVSTASGGGNPGTGGTCGTAGVDYGTITNQPVIFNAGDTEAFATVQICTGDTVQEIPDETASLSMSVVSGASAGAQTTATLRINDTASQFLQSPAHTPIDMFFASSANPYPSTITVSGAPNIVGTMRVTLYDVSHANPDNMDVLLVGPLGQKYLLLADTGGPAPISPDAPVTLTFSDFAAAHVPDSAAWTTGQFLPTVCESNTVFAPPAPVLPYVTPNCSTPNALGQTMFGSPGTGFGLTNPNAGGGVWSLYVRDDAGQLRPIGDDAANFAVGRIAGGWGLEFLAPTASDVSIAGRVLSDTGRGIRGARVIVTGNSLATPISVMTGANGRYTVPGLTAGETYVVTVQSRRFVFEAPSRVITLNDNVTDADFTGSAGSGGQ